MDICLLKGKIHGAKITDGNVAYEGSVTVDGALMDAAGIVPYEKVHVWSLSSGERLETYAIPGPAGKGEVCMNGAAALRIKTGERVIIAAFAWIHDGESQCHHPSLVYVDERNNVLKRMTGRP